MGVVYASSCVTSRGLGIAVCRLNYPSPALGFEGVLRGQTAMLRCRRDALVSHTWCSRDQGGGGGGGAMASNPAAWPRAPLSPSYCVCINNVGEAPRRVILLVVYAIALPPGSTLR